MPALGLSERTRNRDGQMLSYDPLDKMLKIGDVAEILHVHPNTLRRWCERGRIESYRLGSRGDHRFPQSEVARFLADSIRSSKISNSVTGQARTAEAFA